MANSKKPEVTRFHFTLFRRLSKVGDSIFYARFLDKQTNQILAQRSTGCSDERSASAAAGQLLLELPLEALAQAKEEGKATDFANVERMKDTVLSDFFTLFWADDSPYIKARAEAGKPISKMYIFNKQKAVKRFVVDYPAFKRTPLRSTTLLILEGFRDYLRNKGVSANIRNDVLNTLQSPVSWAQKRGLVDATFSFAAIERPKDTFRKRGILTKEEIAKLIALPVAPIWVGEDSHKVHVGARQRPRLAKGLKNEGPPLLDIRQKAAILLSIFAGLRRGEIRALRWESVDFDAGEIHITENFVPLDGLKKPKADSDGIVPILDALLPILTELRDAAKRLGLNRPKDFVLMGASPEKPVHEITLARGFNRALKTIGITDDQRKARNLVFHSGRHSFATEMADKIGSRSAALLTRHKSTVAFDGYGSHVTKELLERGRTAFRTTKKDQEDQDATDDTPRV